jgi:hypothetical protein
MCDRSLQTSSAMRNAKPILPERNVALAPLRPVLLEVLVKPLKTLKLLVT